MQTIDPKAAIELSEYLKPKIQGEIKFDKLTRALYSTDASIYQIEPAGVITPKSNEDVAIIIDGANKFNIPILFIIYNLSKSFNNFIKRNPFIF